MTQLFKQAFHLCPIGLTLLLSCSQIGKNSLGNFNYFKVEIYCGCIVTVPSNVGSIVMSNCSSPYQLPPSRFIKQDVLYYSSTDTSTINSISRMFFSSKHSSDTLIGGTDSRFVVLLKKNEKVSDTLVFRDFDHRTFSFNEKYNYKYDFNVIDSLRKILKKDKIECK